VKGNPGAGKSVLMKFAVTMMDHRKSGEIVLSFFIHGRGTLLQKTPLGVFRALLNSMLKYFPHYLSQLTERFEDQEKRFGSYGENRWDWAQKELQDFTSKVITKGTQNRPVAIFVDALDECGRDFAKELLTYFKDLFEEIKREGAQVKICLSSRHYPILGHDTIPTVSVEERNDKDIRLVIQRRLREIEPATKRQRIEKDILLKAQGGFQWAVLVSDMVTDENITGMKAEKLHEKLASIPEHLDELYTDILGGSTAIENNQMTRLFQWILFSERPLSAQELRDALATDKDMTYTSVSEFRSHEVWIDDIAQFERRIKHISRGLVEFQTREFWEQYELGGEDSNREVQFIHQSVADYMLNKFLNNVEHHYGTPQAQTGAGHFQISRSCLKYLTIEEVLQAHQLSRGKLSARFPLAPYATRFIFDHIRKVEQEGIPQLDLLSLIQWKPQSEPLRNLASLWRILDPNSAHAPMGWPFVGATALHALIAFGSKSAFDTFLQRNDVEVDGRDSDGNTPLLLAIREGHQGMALALINYSIERTSSWSTSQGDENARGVSRIVDIDAENDHGETPLTVALTEKAGEVIFKLVDAGAALKLFGRETALLYYTIRERNEKLLMKLIEKNILLDGGVYFALKEFSNGEDKVLENFIQLLLEAGGNRSKSTEFDEYDHEEDYDEDYDEDDEYLDDAALFWASRRGQGAIVNLLLSHGASADSQNTMGDLPLHLALKKNHEVVVGILIREAPLTADIGDKNGQTPLELAVDAGNEAIVKLLLTKELLNIDKTIPLRIAIHDGHTAVIELFLATKRFDVNIKDFNERPLLLWAVETENEAAVKQLLATEQIDVNAMNSDRWTPLMHAIEYEKECMVKLLLATRKANINLEYPDGQTLLSRATRTSNKAITLALLSTGKFNVNARDSDGHTLLSRAAKTGNETVVELLLATAKVKVDAKDRDGQTPLAWAVWNAHTVIFKLLLATGKVNINAKYHNGQTLLSRAVEKSNEVIAQALLATGKFDVNVWGVYGQTLLSRAAETKNETMVKMLLATEQVDVDAKDIDGWTPLAWAVQNGYSGIVRLLLETRKVNVNVRDANGQTLLSLASMDGRISMVRLFLESEQVEVDAEDAKGGTPLAWAVQNGYSGIVKLLLETGKVNVNARDANKRTPLSLASENGNESIVELLLSTEQIDIDVEDAEGWTALAWAVQNGRSGIVRLLLETGKVNANARDANKRTLLSLASENGDEPIVKLFLAAEQVEVDAEDTYGWTPLAWAVENGYCGIVRLLLETGKVNINLRDTDGQTLLSRAVENGDELIAELLLATSAIEADA
jgi:ankyrin repeat protein